MGQASVISRFHQGLGRGSDMQCLGGALVGTSPGQVFGDKEIEALVPIKSFFCDFMSNGLVPTTGGWIPHGVCGTCVPGFGNCLVSVLICP